MFRVYNATKLVMVSCGGFCLHGSLKQLGIRILSQITYGLLIWSVVLESAFFSLLLFSSIDGLERVSIALKHIFVSLCSLSY